MTPLVDTTAGRVSGTVRDGIQVFRGIPYAAPPVRELRFRPPQSPKPWTGVLEATGYGSIAPQNPSPLEQMVGGRPSKMDEDCLTLNVWTPGLDGGRPVLVWIHGGAFVTGSGSTPWYDGRAFARNGDVVVVTLNYRLGALGFLDLEPLFGEDFRGSGNAGVLDQSLALEWVRDNIEGFGGDPAQVTIFGESAGAFSVATQLGLASSRGLFTGAIAQSPPGHAAHSRESAARITSETLRDVGIGRGDGPRLMDLPVDQLLHAQGQAYLRHWRNEGMPFRPVVDGATLPRPVLDAVREGELRDVRLITGTTAEEMRLFSVMDPNLLNIDRDRIVKELTPHAGARADSLVDLYVRNRPGTPLAEVATALATDRVFRIPAIELAEAQAAHQADTWMYLFTWQTPVFGGALGSCHALEIPFVFNALHRGGAEMFCGPDAPAELARRMHTAWIGFARDNDTGWPRYAPPRRATQVFGDSFEVVDDPAGDEREAWAALS